ncbi:hypothetical protein QO010_001231 [Caulobacter ginsengisoli]|uniref:Sulfotransferase family protein n=1 Tax=Caulobacter ginsengisoli TaxID=400775 RepID=A0ABU0IN86_9CAUL|nr:hypothetical protein [Caulobacter ginsengisoli]MDQ0463460.1 hypothetical protein [Caulobacter ginsengisoli]
MADQSVTALSLTPRDYEIISFLDQRLLMKDYPRKTIGWDDIEDFSQGDAEALDYIFHIGHVGSTLLSRVLGQNPGVFSLREPAALRRLTELHGALGTAGGSWTPAAWESRAGGLLRLWSRVWLPGQRTLLKATSSVGEIATVLLARNPAARAVLLTVKPETYMATILGGPSSRVELEQMTPGRLQRLHRRLGGAVWRAEGLSEGERTAMSWACEMAGLAQAAAAHPAGCRWLDFDALLARPRESLALALTHLRGAAPADAVDAMAASPYFSRYSKAPEYGYDAGLRRQVLDQARAEHGVELRRGMAWLDQAARDHPLIAGLLAAQP